MANSFVFNANVQAQINNYVVVKVREVVKMVRKAINNEKIHWSWNGVESFSLVTGDTLRHKGSNYDEICKADWFLDLKSQYGEAIQTLLKCTVMNKINSAVLNQIPREFADYQSEAREISDNLNSMIEAQSFEISILQQNNAILTSRVEELEVKNFDLEVESHSQKKDIKGLSDSVSALIAQANKTMITLENTRSELQDTRSELQDTRSELQDTRSELGEAREMLKEVMAENVVLKNEIIELRAENVSIRERLDRLENYDLSMKINQYNVKEAVEVAANVTRDLTVTLTTLEDEVSNLNTEDLDTQVVLLEQAHVCKGTSRKLITFVQTIASFLCVSAPLSVAKALFCDSVNLIDFIESIT